MSRFQFEPFEGDDFSDAIGNAGLDIGQIDFSILNNIDASLMTVRRPSPYRRHEWWETSEADHHHLDRPHFDSAADRVKHLITASARAYQRTIGADDRDTVHEASGKMVSLWDLLDAIDEMECERLRAWMDRQD